MPGLRPRRAKSRAIFLAFRLHALPHLQGKPPTKKAKVLHKAAWSAKIGAFLHSQGTGQLADGTPTGQDGKTAEHWCSGSCRRLGWEARTWAALPGGQEWQRWPASKRPDPG